MISKTIKNICYIGIFSSLIFIMTFFIKIPYAGGAGYFNLSDALIIFSTIYLGPIVGFFSGIIGTSLGDLASGYAMFIPSTIIAKGLESLVTFIIYYFLSNRKYLKYLSNVIAPFFMMITYFISYIVLFNLEYAYISLGFDVIQGISGTIISIILINIVDKILIKRPYLYTKRSINKQI